MGLARASQGALKAPNSAHSRPRCPDPLPYSQPRHLAAVRQSRAASKGDCRADVGHGDGCRGQLRHGAALTDEASKGASGRVIPLNKELRAALQRLHDQRHTSPYVITTERSHHTSASAIVNLFASLVSCRWLARLLKSFRPPNVHHQRRPHDLDGWWFVCVTYRCWPAIAHSAPRSATLRLMRKLRSGLWIWFNDRVEQFQD